MTALHVLAVTCFAIGVAVVVLSSLAVLRLRRPEDRLHLLTPITALGTPLIGLGLTFANGWSLTSAQIVLTCGLVMFTGPVLTSSALRVTAQRAGTLSSEEAAE